MAAAASRIGEISTTPVDEYSTIYNISVNTMIAFTSRYHIVQGFSASCLVPGAVDAMWYRS